MRGKDDMQAAIYREIGITPAYAGKRIVDCYAEMI